MFKYISNYLNLIKIFQILIKNIKFKEKKIDF